MNSVVIDNGKVYRRHSADNQCAKLRAGRLNVDEIRQLARGRWPEILGDLCGLTPDQLEPVHQPCPKAGCGGTDRYRAFDDVAETGGLICNKCGTFSDGFAAVQWWFGCEFPEAVRLVAEYVGLEPDKARGSARKKETRAGTLSAKDVSDSNSQPSTDDEPFVNPIDRIAGQKRVPRDSLVAYGAIAIPTQSIILPAYGPDGKRCTTFQIWASGTVVEQKGKFKTRKLAGMFFPHDNAGGVSLPQPGEKWCLTEGFKDSGALHGLGYKAAGLPTSSMNKKFAELFSGVDVVVIPDLDAAGQKGAGQTASRLAGIAASVRIAELPGEIRESGGADVRDVLAGPDGEALVRRAIAEAADATQPNKLVAADGEFVDTWKGRNLTDLGNGERFAAQHGANVRYCHAWKKWLVWDGTRWQLDSMGEIERLAKRTIRLIHLEAANENIDHDESEKISRHAHSSEQSGRIRSLLSLAQSEQPIPIAVESLDAEPWLLNCENGTIDLTTGQLREHRQEDLITKRCPVEYPTEAGDEPVLWLEFLDKIFAGDAELIGFVQRLMGMSLVGEVLEHILIILYGSGCNGKTVLLEIWGGVLGPDYSMKAPHGFLMAKHNESHPTELADLFGKRLVAVAETTDGSRLSEALVKELTGGDTIRARRMREDHGEFKPSHTVVLATNHRPVVRGTDHGLWRRLRLIPFTVTISDDEKDENLANKLRRELPAILRWAVAGCIDWRRNGLQPPQQVMLATEEYRNSSDVFGSFLDECCLTSTDPTIRASYRIKASSLYANYKKWCEENGEFAETQTKFGTRLSERTDLGIYKKKISTVWWVGITNREIPNDKNESGGDESATY